MILVMPQLWATPGPFDAARNVEMFRDDLTREVIPWADAHLRTLKGPRYRAAGGLGIGRPMLPQVIWPALRQFGTILFVSGGTSPTLFAALDTAHPGAIDDPRAIRDTRFFLSDGKADASLADSQTLAAELRRRGYRVDSIATAGNHGWPAFRRGFMAFAAQAFRDGR